MSDERKYYVLCERNCKFESMTKEQILTAIAQAVESGEIKDVDTGFVTTIKTINDKALKFFIGKQSEYESLSEEDKSNLFAIITNDTTKEGLLQAISDLTASHNDLKGGLSSGSFVVAEATHASNATSADNATHADDASHASSATKATQDSEENIIVNTYAKKADLLNGTLVVKKADNATNATNANSAKVLTNCNEPVYDNEHGGFIINEAGVYLLIGWTENAAYRDIIAIPDIKKSAYGAPDIYSSTDTSKVYYSYYNTYDPMYNAFNWETYRLRFHSNVNATHYRAIKIMSL